MAEGQDVRPIIGGDHLFERDSTFDGMIGGDAILAAGVTVDLGGMVGGDVIVREGAVLHLTAMVGGDVILRGGRLAEG